MFGTTVGDTATDLTAQFSATVDDLQQLELTALADEQLLDVLRELETQHRRLAAVDQRLIAEIEARGLAGQKACRNTAALLGQLLRISPAEASARLRAAADTGPRRGLTGEMLAPIYPRVAAAQADGTISAVHARIITHTIDRLPVAVQADYDQSLEAFLVAKARLFEPRLLAQVARRICDTLDPDGTGSDEKDRQRRRELRIRRRSDGSARVEGELTAICAEALLAVLESLGKPKPEADGVKDARSAGQRNHDALHDAMLMLLRTDLLPDCNGVAATILITMTDQQYQNGQGVVRTGQGAYISTELALTLHGDARLVPIIFGSTKQVTAYGTAHRIFTEGQRLAMIARDLGCSFPACTDPPSRCEAHHVTDYAITRRTTIEDGTMLCGYHHREHPRLGWTCQMINGRPHWTAPHWLDPTQTPRRNHAHDPLDD